MSEAKITALALVVREGKKGPVYAAKWRRNDEQVMRTIGPAWVIPDGEDEKGRTKWKDRQGRPPAGHYKRDKAIERRAELIAEHDEQQSAIERGERERQERGVTFREVAHKWLDHRERVKRDKPSTMRDRRSMLAEPGAAHRRGQGTCHGRIMATLGDLPAAGITTRQVSVFLDKLDAELSQRGGDPTEGKRRPNVERNVNKHRAVLSAIFNYGMRADTFGLPANPVTATDKREEPEAERLDYYSTEEIESLARALAAGAHRTGDVTIKQRPGESAERVEARRDVWAAELDARRADDAQDAELVRVAAYTGLRRGELVALRWRDVQFADDKIVVRKALSAGKESGPKSKKAREVPLPAQAAVALDRLSQRQDFTGPGDFVFVNRLGGRLDPDAVSDRVMAAMSVAGLRTLRFHDLRHTYGSLLAAAGIDLATIKAAMGHAKITTTERYLHARSAGELAGRVSTAFGGVAAGAPDAAEDAQPA